MKLLVTLAVVGLWNVAQGAEQVVSGVLNATVQGQMVTIKKVGFPDERVYQRQACGQRQIEKSFLNPDYFLHTIFQGFSEGSCPSVGYEKFEKTEVVDQRWTRWSRPSPISFDIYTRDPTARDVAGCIWRECGNELNALGHSHYVSDVAHCISPAFGPCVPKAWACLGDQVCREAVECLPQVAHDCGKAIWKVATDPAEREKLACILSCNNSKLCIIAKCSKDALECFTGIGDPVCHEAAMCIPKKLMGCSVPAFNCIFDRNHGVCRENLACAARGMGTCADSTVNLMTDKSISQLMYCANDRCPAPTGSAGDVVVSSVQQPKDNLQESRLSLPKYPGQLACMSMKCGFKVASLLTDKDIGALSTCLLPGLAGCGDKLWDCIGDSRCQSELQCWADGMWGNAQDIWKMVTDKVERQYDEDLYDCLQGCMVGHKTFVGRAFCVAGSCGLKSSKCMLDPSCRHVFTDLPYTLAKCSTSSIMDPKFRDAATCASQIASTCGTAGIELVRDRKLADVVNCNSRCTYAPSGQVEDVIV